MRCLILYLIILCITVSCSSDEPLDEDDCRKLWSKDSWVYSDSLQVNYMLDKWYDLKYFNHRSYLNRTMDIDKKYVEISTPAVFYSPDRNRMIVWISHRYEARFDTVDVWNSISSNQLYYYDMSALIGYRSSNDTLWRIFPFAERMAEKYPSMEDAMVSLCNYYFHTMKTNYEIVLRGRLNDSYGGSSRISEFEDPLFCTKTIGYNLNDQDFWNKGLIWQKGASFDSLYPFELCGFNPTSVDLSRIDFPPKTTYPDSILRLFPKAYRAKYGVDPK